MNNAQLHVRQAQGGDVEFIIDLINRVQKKLTSSGSLQQIGPVSTATAINFISRNAAHILVELDRRLGSVFIEPVSVDTSPYLQQWDLASAEYFLWFLHTLAIEPDEQGRGLGYHFLDGIKSYISTQAQPAMIFLDCWAGNAKLRTFYTQAGFRLHGIYPWDDFEVAVFTYVLSSSL